ncbi:MAG: non-canonical purine NTP diphosphatase [Bacteroidaceae bacterium]|nr:non-canonical purine NTP diphosphatase [Bacteroidaceae bacterium]
MKTLVFATNNKHKLQEVRQILGERFDIKSLADIGCEVDIPETADTLEGNAMQKAKFVKEHYGLDCFADDTGLECRALDGAPGIYSARYAGENHDSEANMRKLLENLREKNDRSAQFRTVIALLYQGEEHLFEGIVRGTIIHEHKGTQGFGYDPVFVPEGFHSTFAEMTADEKNSISHRGRAVAKLADFLTGTNE